MSKRRAIVLVASVLPVVAHVACASTNGEPIPNEVFDASPLDAGANPDDPDGGSSTDGGGTKDAAKDVETDAGSDSGGPAVVVINELYVDRIADGDGAEFVELRTTPGAAVDDLKLRLVYANGEVKYEVAVGEPGARVGASGLWVVGGNQTFKLRVQDRVDRVVPLAGWGLDQNGAVQLVRGGTLLDVVGYTTDPDGGAPPSPALPPTKTVEGKPAKVPANAGGMTKRRSFGRKAAAPDADDNATDFCTMEASPGHTQKACE